MPRRKAIRIAECIVLAVLLALVPVLIAEGSIHGWRREEPNPSWAEYVARQSGAAWQPVEAAAADGVVLKAWLFQPRQPNGAAVILLHGVNDKRTGVIGHVEYLLRAGYTVLATDSRCHGVSGGAIMTYGILEASDVHIWADRLFRDPAIHRLYGLGASMGAAILIQSLAREPRFRSIVAECPFFAFPDVAYYRLEQISHLGRWISWPTAQAGFLYVRVRYGIDLTQASPAAVVATTHVPILLIHGLRDTNIPPSHSERLHALNPRATRLWLVPNAAHVDALGESPVEYKKNVLEWFQK